MPEDVAAAQRPPAHPGHHVHRRAAHRPRYVQSSPNCEITSRPVACGSAAHRFAGPDFHWLPHRHGRPEVRARERNHRGAFKHELASGECHFECRSIRRIAHQQIARSQGQRVRRPRCRDPEVRVAESSQVLHRGQKARRDDVYIAQRPRLPNRNEAHPVAHAQQRRRSGRKVEQLQVGAADQPPASGRCQWINSGLRPADRDASHRHVFARSRQPWSGQFGRQAAQVGKAGRKADEVDHVLRRRVQFHNARFGESGVPGHVRQVRAKLAAIADGDLQVPRFGGRLPLISRHPLEHERFYLVVRAQARIEIHQHRSVRGVQVEYAADPFQAARQAGDGDVGIERNLVAEREQKRAIACRSDGH